MKIKISSSWVRKVSVLHRITHAYLAACWCQLTVHPRVTVGHTLAEAACTQGGPTSKQEVMQRHRGTVFGGLMVLLNSVFPKYWWTHEDSSFGFIQTHACLCLVGHTFRPNICEYSRRWWVVLIFRPCFVWFLVSLGSLPLPRTEAFKHPHGHKLHFQHSSYQTFLHFTFSLNPIMLLCIRFSLNASGKSPTSMHNYIQLEHFK